MAAIADYAVRALLLRSSRSSQGKDAQIHIWQPSSDTYKDFEETLPLLPERPLWVHASEYANSLVKNDSNPPIFSCLAIALKGKMENDAHLLD